MNTIERIEAFYSKLRFRETNVFFKRMKFYSMSRYLVRRFANWWLPIYLNRNKNRNEFRLSDTDRRQKILVSLTSFPKRINTVWMVVETLLRQSVKPDMILLWLSKKQFNDGLESLPKSLTDLCARGLTIRFVEEDIRSHKKYYYAVKEYPNEILITVDDDIFYSPLLIEKLLKASDMYPNAIVSKFAYKINWQDDNKVGKYKNWTKISSPEGPSFNSFFGTGGGTLFPPASLYKDITNVELAMKLCPLADDVYVNSMARLAGTKVCIVDQNFTFIPFLIENNETLADSNLELEQNDVQIEAINNYYVKTTGKNIYNKQWNG